MRGCFSVELFSIGAVLSRDRDATAISLALARRAGDVQWAPQSTGTVHCEAGRCV